MAIDSLDRLRMIRQPLRGNSEARQRTEQALTQTAQARGGDRSPGTGADMAQMSDELLEQVDEGKASAPQGGDFDQMLAAMAGNFLDQQALANNSAQVGDGGGGEEKAEWKPEIQPKQVLEPNGKMGEVTITKGAGDKGDKGGSSAPVAGGTGPGGASAASKPASNAKSTAQSTHTKQPSQNGKPSKGEAPADNTPDDSVELSPESQATARQLQAQGMQTPGLDSNGRASGAATQGEKGGGGKPSQIKFDVEANSMGFTQSVWVRPSSEVKNGDLLMTYRKLDDLPSGNVAVLKRKTGEEAVRELTERQQRGEQIQPMTRQQVDQLLNPTATEQ